MQVVHIAFFKSEVLVENFGLVVDGVDKHRSRTDRFRCLQTSLQRVLQQGCT